MATITTETFGDLVVGNGYSAFDLAAKDRSGTFAEHRGHIGSLTFEGASRNYLEFRCGCGEQVAIGDAIIAQGH